MANVLPTKFNPIIRFPSELKEWKYKIEEAVNTLGITYFPIIFEMVDWKTLYQICANGGFAQRYKHWSFGQEYDHLIKQHSYQVMKISEMITPTNPSIAYLMSNNTIADQKMVMSHCYFHSFFSKNNIWFQNIDTNMLNTTATHAKIVDQYIDKFGENEVEQFIDLCLSIDHHIDRHALLIKRKPLEIDNSIIKEEQEEENFDGAEIYKVDKNKEYLAGFVNPQEVLEQQRKDFKEELKRQEEDPSLNPERDLLLFLTLYAPLKPWQRHILSIIRSESYFFSPIGMTKIENEGLACLTKNSLIFTDKGIFTIKDIIEKKIKISVYDGEKEQKITNYFQFEERDTYKIVTKRGYELECSDTHKIMFRDNSWKESKNIIAGDEIIIGRSNIWASEYVKIDYEIKRRKLYQDVINEVPYGEYQVDCYYTQKKIDDGSLSANHILTSIGEYKSDIEKYGLGFSKKRKEIAIPIIIDEYFGEFLGLLLSDGHISESGHGHIGLTTGDLEQLERFEYLIKKLFSISGSKNFDTSGGSKRWRFQTNSMDLMNFLNHLGLHIKGYVAKIKEVPECILKSPKSVVAAFIKGYADGDGCASLTNGLIISSSSKKMVSTLQLLLLNFGIISSIGKNKKKGYDDNYQLRCSNEHVKIFYNEIGFGLKRKQEKLKQFIDNHRWWKEIKNYDKIKTIEYLGKQVVCDITVENTHQYCAQGFVNHNSLGDSLLCTQKGIMTDAEIIDYADHHAAVLGGERTLNPYKLGYEILSDIKERWDKGQFGKDWEECEDANEKRKWDKNLGLGLKKVFEVCTYYNDITLIDEFLTYDLCKKLNLFSFEKKEDEYYIDSREYQKVKIKILDKLTNHGRPQLLCYKEKNNILVLKHENNKGVGFDLEDAKATLLRIQRLWNNEVRLIVKNGKEETIFYNKGGETQRAT